MTKCQTLVGIYVPVFYNRPDIVRHALEFLARNYQSGKLKANVAAVLPLSRTADAHRLLEERRAQGVVILDPRN
jgi:NADPH2:quinone reductase